MRKKKKHFDSVDNYFDPMIKEQEQDQMEQQEQNENVTLRVLDNNFFFELLDSFNTKEEMFNYLCNKQYDIEELKRFLSL